MAKPAGRLDVLSSIAVISDVHSNLEALTEVLGKVQGFPLYCLGDIVGYGGSPNEVVQALRRRGAICVLGNHDYGVLTGDTSMFNARAAMAAQWTRTRLTGESTEFLRSLPLERRETLGSVSAYFTHGSPDDRLWEYVDPTTHFLLLGHYLRKVGASCMGFGHTHRPYSFSVEEGTVFNPGSVGQPRDGDPRASYSILTPKGTRVEVENHRVEYDVDAAAAAVRAVGLPEALASRLYKGL